MAQIDYRCGACGSPIKAEVGQVASERRLAWHAAYVCPLCAGELVEDHGGFPPDHVREQLLAAYGKETVKVVNPRESVRGYAVIRDLLELDLAAVKSLKSQGLMYSGTPVEARWIADALQERGIKTLKEADFGPFGSETDGHSSS